MAGSSPHEAVANFLSPLQRALSCVARGKFTVSPGGLAVPDALHALTLNSDEGAPLKPGYHLWVRMRYRVVPADDERGPWKVSTDSYDHVVQRASGEGVASWHWHPRGSSAHVEPHLHLAASQLAAEGVLSHKSHVPTSRVPMEDVIAFAIDDLGVIPLRDDWPAVLRETRGAFVRWRTWP